MKVIDALKEKLDVQYCIPNWLRDIQINLACKRFPNRVKPVKELRTKPIALVCFGPSLNKTWEKIKDFKYVMSCSGGHKYLRDKGIIPNWDVEVDPRPHKVKLIGDNISPDTEFLMASCVHPEVFDHLVKHNAKVTLYHTYSGEEKDKLPNIFPRGDWISTGGSNVGLRALVLCRMLGFRNIHIFGMDGSFPADSELKHADFHPNICKHHILAEFDGKQYATTTAFLVSARGTFHELEQLPDVDVTFYGEGLVQDMAKKTPLNKNKHTVIAFSFPETISAEHAEQNRILLEKNPVYGITSINFVDQIKIIINKMNAKSVLDYGCGKGLLGMQLDFPIWEYDPAVPNKSDPPRPADLVTCISVLETIEPEYLDATLEDIARCTKQIAFFVVSPTSSVKTFPNGKNTHLIQKDKNWWQKTLSKYFIVPDDGIKEENGLIRFIAERRPKPLTKELIVDEKFAAVCP